MITLSISPKPFVLCMLLMAIVSFVVAAILVSYATLVTMRGLTIIDSGFEFKDLSEPIKLLGLARTEIVHTKFIDVFSKHWSHYNTFIITDCGAYLISPVSRMLYIIKIQPDDIYYDGIKVDSWNETFAIEKLYKPDRPITLLEYCELYSNECSKEEYSVLNNNCQHTTLQTLKSVVSDITTPIVKGSKLAFLMLRDTARVLGLSLRSHSKRLLKQDAVKKQAKLNRMLMQTFERSGYPPKKGNYRYSTDITQGLDDDVIADLAKNEAKQRRSRKRSKHTSKIDVTTIALEDIPKVDTPKLQDDMDEHVSDVKPTASSAIPSTPKPAIPSEVPSATTSE